MGGVRRLGVTGDTQGHYDLERLLDFFGGVFAPVDEIWFAGDWQDERVLTGLMRLGKPLRVVRGNAPDDPRFPERLAHRVEGLEIGMVHRPPRASDPWLASLDVVIHGHTHRWRDKQVGRCRFLNASTPTAAGFSREASVAILTVDGRKARFERVEVIRETAK